MDDLIASDWLAALWFGFCRSSLHTAYNGSFPPLVPLSARAGLKRSTAFAVDRLRPYDLTSSASPSAGLFTKLGDS